MSNQNNKTMETKTKEAAKKTTSQKKEVLIPMSQFVDALLLKGSRLEEITKKVQAEAKKRKVTTLSTKAQILSHAKYRIGRGMKIKIKDDSVVVTK